MDIKKGHKMKKIILLLVWAVIGSCLISDSYAKTYVLKDIKTDEVYMISDMNNIVNNTSGAEIVVLDKDLEYYGIEESYTDYKLKGKKFILNSKKISDKEAKKEKKAVEEAEKKDINVSIIDKLNKLGFTDAESEYLVR